MSRSDSPPPPAPSFARRAFVAAAAAMLVVVLALLMWFGATILLAAFGGVLLAIFLRGLTDWVSLKTRLSPRWSFAVVLLGIVVIVGGFVWVTAPSVARQVDELQARWPQMVDRFRARVGQYAWGRQLFGAASPSSPAIEPAATAGGAGDAGPAATTAPATTQSTGLVARAAETIVEQPQQVISKATGILSGTAELLTIIVVTLFIGVYVGADPDLYLRGLLRLVPPRRRLRARAVLGEMGFTLRRWLLGQGFSMAVVGAMTMLGLWLIGVPLALTLGLIAGLLEFIPTIGPMISFVPAVLFALTLGPDKALWVAGLYLFIQSFESYALTPLVQKRAIDMPPALTITSQVLMGLIFGGLGLLLATPLLAGVIVAVRMLYVEDALGDKVRDNSDRRADSS